MVDAESHPPGTVPEGATFRAAVRAAADATDALLRDLHNTDARIAGGWTIRETAVHLIVVARIYTALLAGASSPLLEPSHNGALNAGAFLALTEDDPDTLADLLTEAVTRFDAALVDLHPDDARPWHRGQSMPARTHVASQINELLMHGTDIARAAERDWPGDEDAAAIAWQIIAPWQTPVRLLPDAAGNVTARLSFAADGCPPFAFRIAGGTAQPLAPAATVGCRIEGSPMAFLRWFSQRDPWPQAGLRATGDQADVAAIFADLLRRI